MKYSLLILTIFMVFACSYSSKKKENIKQEVQKQNPVKRKNTFENQVKAIFEIQTFDGNRILETGKCFLVTKNIIVAPFSLFNLATRAELKPLNGGTLIHIEKFYVYDRINNLILLQIENTEIEPLKLYGGVKKQGLKTITLGKKRNNTQPLYPGSCLQEEIIEGRKLFNISNVIGKKSFGLPVFVSNGSVLGLGISQEVSYERKYFAIPASDIIALIKKKGTPQSFSSIGSPDAVKNASIRLIILNTSFGDITIRLYNETPVYRDNFIQLTKEGYFDSLLIHRVIRDFGIQTGAADTRHAQIDDIVGWKGPGYTIPAHIIDGLYHKRGAIGSPRKPDTKNKKRRSDGSQFYIVSGRKYLDVELDDIEKDNGIKFTEEQREVYKNIGGSPHLDGNYTVFGEVISGIEIADRITMLPVHGDYRPISDIRLKAVTLVY